MRFLCPRSFRPTTAGAFTPLAFLFFPRRLRLCLALAVATFKLNERAMPAHAGTSRGKRAPSVFVIASGWETLKNGRNAGGSRYLPPLNCRVFLTNTLERLGRAHGRRMFSPVSVMLRFSRAGYEKKAVKTSSRVRSVTSGWGDGGGGAVVVVGLRGHGSTWNSISHPLHLFFK